MATFEPWNKQVLLQLRDIPRMMQVTGLFLTGMISTIYKPDTPGQVLYTTAYDANIVAQAGQISFVKTMDVNTGNKALGQSNVDAKTGLTFIATDDGGNVVGTENLMLDGAGMYDLTANKMLCPFGVTKLVVHSSVL